MDSYLWSSFRCHDCALMVQNYVELFANNVRT